MNREEKKVTASTLIEKAQWFRIGWMYFRFRPLTLGQIYEMGPYVEDIQGDNLSPDNKVNIVAEMLSRSSSARAMQKIFLICLFRNRWCRVLFGRYIKKRLTVRMFNSLTQSLAMSLAANFFLTSIIFLHQTKKMTEPNPTTAHGQSSEE